MKVLLINGSPNLKGCTYTALTHIKKSLQEEGIESEMVNIGVKPVQDCTACQSCKATGVCIFNDIVNEIIEKAKTSDGFILGSPVHYSHPSGRLLSTLSRIFYAGGKHLKHKPASSIVSARRAGTSSSLDVINKHFTINEMPVVSSTYWNMVHGHTPEEVLQDEEGMDIMYALGKNMAWLLKCIDAGKEKGINKPENKKRSTNFIR